MDKIVYFLGAGFSAPLGLPVMSNFLIKSKDMYAANPERYEHFTGVFKMISQMSVTKNYFEADLFNIEEILSILEMEQQIQGKRLEDCFQQYLIDVVKHFTPRLKTSEGLPGNWHRYVFPGPLMHAYAYFIASLLNLSLSTKEGEELAEEVIRRTNRLVCRKSRWPSVSYSIVTLNYDCVVEDFVQLFRSAFDGANLEGVPTSKLHGGVESGRIIPPTWNKTLHPDSVESWKKAFDLLKDANHIRIIGYSLPTTDSYVKYLLKSAAMRAPHLKSIDVLCLDPTGSVKARYDEFINFYRYRFTGARVEDYLGGYFEHLLKPFEHNFTQPLVCNKLEEYHEVFFEPVGTRKNQRQGDERT